MKSLLIKSLLVLFALTTAAFAADPLPSWNDTATKQAVVAFVDKVTTPGSPDFVPVEERIATFDNDGTLWAEQPMYFEFLFAFDRIRSLAPQHPEWAMKEPFASLLKGDVKAAFAGGMATATQVLLATHSGMTTEEFDQLVRDWIAAARHPTTGRPYTEMVYEPMRELLAYLRQNGFKTFIVSGGEGAFMRPWAEKTYGVPPEQVIGSRLKMQFELRDGRPVLLRQPDLEFVVDGPGKALAIEATIGRRPIASFGNSDGDLEMLRWTTAGSGARFAALVHHTDAAREWAYDRQSTLGHLDKALDAAHQKGWTLIDMKADWKVVYQGETR